MVFQIFLNVVAFQIGDQIPQLHCLTPKQFLRYRQLAALAFGGATPIHGDSK